MLYFTFLSNIVQRLPGIMKLFGMVTSKRENNFSTIPEGEVNSSGYTKQGVKSSRLPGKITMYLVSIFQLLCLAFLYGWRFLSKIYLDWLRNIF